MRWSASHLYRAVLDYEPHVSRLAFVTTLAGYVHWRLTGRKVLGVGDASGMFGTLGRVTSQHPQDEPPSVGDAPWFSPLLRVLAGTAVAGFQVEQIVRGTADWLNWVVAAVGVAVLLWGARDWQATRPR